MPLLNYTSRVPASQTANEIMKILGKNGAEGFNAEYDAEGQIAALTWHVSTPHGVMPFRIPVDVKAVLDVLMRQNVLRYGNEDDYERARRCAWRITKDWIAAQMALLQTEMVTVQQLFLPYLRISEDETLYDRMMTTGFAALGPGGEQAEVVAQ